MVIGAFSFSKICKFRGIFCLHFWLWVNMGWWNIHVCMFHQPRFTSFAQSKSKIICYGPFKPVLFSSLMTEKSVYQIYSPYLWYGTIQLVFFTPVASSWFPGHNRTWKQTNTPIKLYSGLLLIFFFRSWIIWPPKKPHVHTPTYMDLSINSFLQHN